MSGEDKTTQTNTSSTTQQATPYSGAKTLLDRGFADALGLYNSQRGVSDWRTIFGQGSNNVANNARTAMRADPLAGAMENWGGTFGADGYNDAQRTSMEALKPTMQGDYLDLSQAPGYQQIRDKIQADSATEAMMSASMNGRGGSPYAQGLVGSKVADTLAGYDLSQYNTERDRQNSAISSMFGMGQTGMGNAAQAGSIWESLYGAQQAPAFDLLALGQTPNVLNTGLLEAASAGLPYATAKGTMSGQGSTAQPSNTFGKIAGAGLGLGSLLFG